MVHLCPSSTKLQFKLISKYFSLSLINDLDLAPCHTIKTCLGMTKALQTVAVQATCCPLWPEKLICDWNANVPEVVQFNNTSLVLWIVRWGYIIWCEFIIDFPPFLFHICMNDLHSCCLQCSSLPELIQLEEYGQNMNKQIFIEYKEDYNKG